jgi:bacterioferritin (cytochrome b1)
MSTIGKNIKDAINNNFMYNVIQRNTKSVTAALNTNVRDSVNMVVLPKVDKVELTKIDDLHDKLSLSWDDYKTEGVITWKPSTNKNWDAMVFCGIE